MSSYSAPAAHLAASPAGGHAVVIGAGMAGLLAARVLAERYARVTLLERDALPAGATPRKGVPQGWHAHGLLVRGVEILESLFPGMTEALFAAGACRGDLARDVHWHHVGANHVAFASGMPWLSLSRPLLEAHVRARLLARPNVAVRDGCSVARLATTPDRARVTGVCLVARMHECSDEVIGADLVVDASGAASRSPAWLEALGYAPPAAEEVPIGIGYTSRYYRRRPGDLGGKIGLWVGPQPPNPRVGLMLAQEDDRWVVTVAGYLGERAPCDEAGFLAFARQLPDPAIYEFVQRAEPISGYSTYNLPAAMRRRYERLRRFPDGFLVIGDAVARFNSIYAQGTTSAALQALALQACLERGTYRLWQRYFRAAARLVDEPWEPAVITDLCHPRIAGKRTPLTRFVHWYIERLHRVAHRDAAVSLAFHQASQLVRPRSAVLQPAIAWRVLRG